MADNFIYAGPGDYFTLVGNLRAGEVVEVCGADETEQWLSVACSRHIAVVCWVMSDTAVNNPTGFWTDQGWQEINSGYVTLPATDLELEAALDMVVASIVFNK